MPKYRFVPHLPDLIQPEEYAGDADGKKVRFQIRWSAAGIEILGDSPRADELERLLAQLGVDEVDQMLCG